MAQGTSLEQHLRAIRDSAACNGTLHPLHRKIEPSRWCITRSDLDAFELDVLELWSKGGIPENPYHPNARHCDPNFGPNIHEVNEHYIKPCTLGAGGMSWALMRNPKGLKCDVFVTHCWMEGVFEFTSKVRLMWPKQAYHLYCCFLSNPQNGNLSELLGEHPMDSPFAKALGSCSHFLVLPNETVSIYSRLWCVFEAHLAIQSGLPIVLPTKPLKRSVVLALLPRLLVLLAAFALSGLLWEPLHLWAGACRQKCLLPRLLRMCLFCASLGGASFVHITSEAVSWTMIVFLGLCMSFAMWHISAKHRCFFGTAWVTHDEFDYMGVVSLIPMFALCGAALSPTVRCCIDDCLEKEGHQLEFDTVRSATCAAASDERKIRKAIAGSEDAIDESIQLLRAVGRFNPAVKAHIGRGMRLTRVRMGVMATRAVAGCCFWCLTFFQTAFLRHCVNDGVAGVSRVECWSKSTLFKSELSAMAISCFVAMLCVHFQEDYAIFVVDALFWSGACAYTAQVLTLWLHQQSSQVAANWSIVVCLVCALGATIACMRFYRVCGFPGARAKDCADDEAGDDDDDSERSDDEEEDAGDESPLSSLML